MTFPMMPVPVSIYTDAPTITYIGATQTTGDGFPSGSLTFTSGTKIIALAVDQAGSLATGVTIGGVAATLAVSRDFGLKTGAIWYLATTASGNLAISGTGGGGGGRSVLYAYEIRGYDSSAPYATKTAAIGTGTTLNVSPDTSTNMLVLGCGMSDDGTVTISADRGVAPTARNTNLEGATAHFAFFQTPTEQGPTTYTVTFPVDDTGECAVVTAVWK